MRHKETEILQKTKKYFFPYVEAVVAKQVNSADGSSNL